MVVDSLLKRNKDVRYHGLLIVIRDLSLTNPRHYGHKVAEGLMYVGISIR